MILELLDELRLVVLIDVGDFLGLDLFQASPLDDSVSNIAGIDKPYRVVLVLQEFAVHPQYLDVVQFGDEVAYLGALELAVLLLIVLNQIHVLSVGSKVIHDLTFWVLPVDLGIELHEEGDSA